MDECKYVSTHHLRRAVVNRGTAQKHVYSRGAISGKVIAVDPANYWVDVAAARGQILRQVPVLSSMGTRAGAFYLQAISNWLATTGPEGSLDTPVNDLKRSVYALVDFLEGNPDQPYVLGFLGPIAGQMHFAMQGMAIWRHESDMYMAVRNGDAETYDAPSDTTLASFELVMPDGTFLRHGQGFTHDDLTAEDTQGLWAVRGTANANTPVGSLGPDTPYEETIYKHASGTAITVDASGNIVVTLAPGATITLP